MIVFCFFSFALPFFCFVFVFDACLFALPSCLVELVKGFDMQGKILIRIRHWNKNIDMKGIAE